MAQHETADWSIEPVDGGNVSSNGNNGGFVGQVDHHMGSYMEGLENQYGHIGYQQSANSYGQQSHGQYPPQQQYSNLSFGVDGQHGYSHDVRSLDPSPMPSQSHSRGFQQTNPPYANNQGLDFRQFQPQEIVGGVPSGYEQYHHQPQHQPQHQLQHQPQHQSQHQPQHQAQQQPQQQPQHHAGVNEFQRSSWAETTAQHNPPGPYVQGQQPYGNNPSLLRMTTASPAQSSTPKPEQSQASYQVDPASSFQPHAYAANYPASQPSDIRQGYPGQAQFSAAPVSGKNVAALGQTPGHGATNGHPVSWAPQGQAQNMGSVPLAPAQTRVPPPTVPRPTPTAGSRPVILPTSAAASASVVFIHRTEKPDAGWTSPQGCPNLFTGPTAVRRQALRKTAEVKPCVAGDPRNGGRMLPLLPSPLPCEMLRDALRPVIEEQYVVDESIKRLEAQIGAASAAPESQKGFKDELASLKRKKRSLTNREKDMTNRPGAIKIEKRRAIAKSEAVEYESESTTDSSDEEDEDEIKVREIMASKTRPNDPEKGTEYDIVKIIRREADEGQSGGSQSQKEDAWSKVIGRRVGDFGKYVVDICAEAKSLRERKSAAPKTQSSQLQTAIDSKYHLVRVALDTILNFGDEETLRNMGLHKKLLSSLTILLSRHFAVKAYNTDLPRSILHFFSEATLMDMDVFQQVKLSSVLEKHGDNLDAEGKQLVADISKNAQERTAKNAADKPAVSNQPKPKPLEGAKERDTKPIPKAATVTTKDARATEKPHTPQLSTKAVLDQARKGTQAYSGLISARKAAVKASPTKRPRDDEVDSRATKKVATGNTTGALGSSRPVTPAVPNSTVSTTTPSNGQPRPRPSGSTVLSKSRTVTKPPIKKSEPQSLLSSTISGLLAEIAKPAEKPKPVEQPVKAPETSEERARRLRREARRGRTVRWKPDEELVQVRIFEHDSNEDEGRASNMIRDARDNRQEGQMLKQMQRNMQEGDDEDEDGNPMETDIRSWNAPQAFDYSGLDDGQRQKNYVTRGGTRVIDSEQKKVMDEYENRELMSIYTTASEIPASARSPKRMPAELPGQPTQGLLLANDTQKQEVHQRWSESRQHGATVASQYALRRLPLSKQGNSSASTYNGAGSNTASAQSHVGDHLVQQTQEERDARVIALLRSERAKTYVDPNPYNPANRRAVSPPTTGDLEVQKAFSIIANAVDQCKDLPHRPVATSHPSQSTTNHSQNLYNAAQTDPYAAWQMQAQAMALAQQQAQQQGYPQMASQVPDQYATILQQVQALQNPQAAASQQPTQAAQPDNNSLASLLATLGGGSAQPAQAQAQAQTSTPQDANYAAWQAWAASQAQAYGAQFQQQQSQQQQSYGSYGGGQYGDNTSSSHDEGLNYGSQRQEYDSHHRDGGERRKDFNRDRDRDRGGAGQKDHNKGINRALIGTKPCSFWAKGQCAKGDNCTFRHDPNDLK
ncbi:hypothetical protein F4808DRAFT_295442 [Astrocystis sublimbata]|nr:hypothetical protein F4808DRAFT_295442 [Astrocystis sublimbata]